MIFTDRTITVRKGESRIDEPIVVYRGDYELEVRFTILNSRFKFMSGTNMIESEKASYGQLAILTPYGGNIFSDVVRCNDGSVTFVLTAEMLNQIEEIGLYSFQIRLMDYNKESRVSIPPIEFGIEVREPIASEDHDNSVNNAIVGYSIAKVVDPKEENVGNTFDESGNYNKTEWETGDRISEGKLNKIEDAIDKVNRNENGNTATLSKRIDNNFNVLDATKADTSTTDSLQNQINNLILESGGDSNLEVVQARGDFQTLGMRLNNIEDELFPLAVSHDGVVYDSVIDRINGTFSSIIDSDYNLWPHGIFELGYNIKDTWTYRDYDVTNNIENNVEYILSYDKAEGFVNTGMGSVIFYNGDDTEILRIAIKRKTHFKAPSETVKTIIRFQPISGDPAPNAGIATVSGIRLSKSDIIKLGDDVRIPVLDTLLEKHFGSLNLFDKNTVSDGVYMGGDGVIYPNDAYVLSNYIPVKRDITVVCNKHIRFVVFFDSSYNNYEYLENVSYPFNAKNDGYMRISISKSNDVSDTMINYGTTALPYTKYDVTEQLIELTPLKDDISSLEEKTKHIIPYSQNLFDKRAITEGYYCNENGNLNPDEKYFVSDYMPVQPRDVLWSNMSARFFTYFDKSKQYVGHDIFIINKTLDDNVYYVRITYDTTNINSDIMVNTGGSMLPFKEYDERMTLDVVTELEERVDVFDDVFGDDIEKSPNLANPELFIKDKYTMGDGTLGGNPKYFVTDVISVKPGDKIQSNTNARFLATYDINGVFIDNRYSDILVKNKVYIVEDGVYGVRYTFWTEDMNNIMVYFGEEYMSYEEFGLRYKNPLTDVVKNIERSTLQSNSIIGGNADNITTDKLVSGDILKLSDFPNNLKKGTCLSFYCNFDSFDTIEIGKGGEGVYRSDWIKIDSTNITLIHYENSLPVENRKTIKHGLNVSKFIGITISCDDEGVAHINFITLGGYFKWDVNIGYEFNGTPFVRAGSDLANVTLSATNVNFRKPVWLFGDSYFGVGDNRVIGQLKNLGYFNFLADGLAGQNSNGALGELEKCLKFGTPKYLVWCLGMNDTDDLYKTVLNKVRTITRDNGITLIVTKIPSVPPRIHEGKNDYIESIGIRYVDSYTAVGATSNGTWYDGYLDGDKVHPTNKGAAAIAMRILIDVPEMLQYGMSKLDGVSGDISGDL